MTTNECHRFNSCSAPLCPLDPQSLEFGIWFPTEDVCARRFADGTPRWVKLQRRIQRKVGRTYEIGYFTHKMLEVCGKVGAGIRGINPESLNQDKRIAAWISARRLVPQKGPMSQEQKTTLRERLSKARAKRKRDLLMCRNKAIHSESNSGTMSEDDELKTPEKGT